MGNAGPQTPAVNVPPSPVHVVVVKNEDDLRQYLESNAGARIVTKHIRNNRGGAGFDT